jgi:hypothetical protein
VRLKITRQSIVAFYLVASLLALALLLAAVSRAGPTHDAPARATSVGATTLPAAGPVNSPNAPAAKSTLIDGQGIYETCDPTQASCRQDLTTIASAGLSLVLNYDQFASDTSLTNEYAYAQAAEALHLQIIWSFKNFFYTADTAANLSQSHPAMTRSLENSGACPVAPTTDYGFVNCLVHVLSTLNATWGYYIGDEPPASEEPTVRPMADAIWDGDPIHPRLLVVNGGDGQVHSDVLQAYGRSYFDGYETHPDATVLAEDFYPIGTKFAPEAAAVTKQIASGLHALATQEGIGYGMVLQAHSLTQYQDAYPWCHSMAVCPYPTFDQMVAMRDAVLQEPSPRLILWYSFFDLLTSDDFIGHWSFLSAAINA